MPFAVMYSPAFPVLARVSTRRAETMNRGLGMDFVVLAVGIVFFALSLAYVRACDSL